MGRVGGRPIGRQVPGQCWGVVRKAAGVSAVEVEKRLGPARAVFDGHTLCVATGVVERKWRWTGNGFLTCSLRNSQSSREWCRPQTTDRCDWLLPPSPQEPGAARLVDVRLSESDDQGFTSAHLACWAEVEYPQERLVVLFIAWAYPNAPGIRTQLRIEGLPGYDPPEDVRYIVRSSPRVEYVPVDFDAPGTCLRRRLIGYYNDTQHRNDTHLDNLKEEVIDVPLRGTEVCHWNSALCVEDDREGIALVQESHTREPGGARYGPLSLQRCSRG